MVSEASDSGEVSPESGKESPETISTLQETVFDPQIANGQHLDPSTAKLDSTISRVASINSVIDITLGGYRNSRRGSVIVHTSTPEVSSVADQEGNSFFGTGENLEINPPAPESSTKSIPAPFLIYQDPPSQPPVVPKIVIVDTPSTAFDNDKENIGPQFLFSQTPTSIMTEDEEEVRKFQEDIANVGSRFNTLIMTYDPSQFPVKVVRLQEANWTRKLEDCIDGATKLIEEVKDKDWFDENSKKMAEDALKLLRQQTVQFVTQLSLMILAVEEPPAPNPVQLSSASGGSNLSGSASNLAAKNAQINADIDAEKISMEVKSLTAETKRFGDWSVAPDHEIEVAMGKLESWRKRMKEIRETLYSLRRNIQMHGLDETKLRTSTGAVDVLQTLLDSCIEDIQFENEERCLYSLNKSRSGDVKMPRFGANLDEDFLKFEKELKDAFHSNHVRRDLQVRKLLECLHGQPKTLIPETLANIDEALDILRKMYGSPSRLVKARKSKLLNMGPCPRFESKTFIHTKAKVEWLMEVQLLLKDLFDLAAKDDDSYCEVYNTSSLNSLKSFFPYKIHNDLNKFKGSIKEKMEQMLDYIKELFDEANEMYRDLEESKTEASAPASGGRRTSGAAKIGAMTGGPPGNGGRANKPAPIQFFRTPTRFEKCRICTTLQTQGICEDIYEDHYSDHVIGCPKFANMSTADRRKYAIQAKMCLFCLDSNWIFNRAKDQKYH